MMALWIAIAFVFGGAFGAALVCVVIGGNR